MEIRKITLSDQIYENLKQSILEGKINFGERLINRDLQKKFGVSSTPIRDSINRLYLDGLVDNINNSGAKIIDFDLRFTLEVNEMVAMLCSNSVEMAAKRSDHDLVCQSLAQNIDNQEASVNMEEFYSSDYFFHRIFFEHSANSQCLKCYDQYHVLWEMLVRRFHYFKQEQKSSTDQHKAIYEAFKIKDFQKAYDMTKSHFVKAEEIFRKYME